MSASPGSRSPGLGQNTSLASFGHVGDERDFEKLPSVIPDSQVTSNVYTSKIHVKRFSVPKEDVSISNISEGFSFGTKKPPRPGQFSERPKTEQSQTNETSKFFHSTSTVPRIPPPNPPRPPNIRIPRPPPLDLPEIGLVGRQPSPHGSPAPSYRDIAVSPRQQGRYSPKSSRGGTPQNINTGPAVLCAESSERMGRAAVVGLPAPPPRTKAFSSSPQPSRVADQVETSQHTQDKSHIAFVPASERVRNLEHLKLPLPHIAQNGPPHHRVSSPSTCGDLEMPAPQSPRATRRSRSSRGYWSRQPTARSDHYRDSEKDLDRPQSRASNVSRKRSSRRNGRSRTTVDPDRKKLAMQNVAQHWNECIQISEAERIEAAKEIARLEDEVRCAEEALEMSKHLICEKDTEIQELVDLHKARKEEGSLAEKESQKLLSEVESLRSGLAKSQEDKAAIHQKYCKNRNKLNEAMTEQQDLFKRMHALYKEIMELQKGKEKRDIDAKDVELALEASRKKREELRSCVEKYRAETEQETQKKNHVIGELKIKLEHQQQALIRERTAASELQSRLKTESTLVDMVKNMQSNLSTLKENSDKHNARSQNQDRMNDRLSEKLDHLSDHLSSHIEGQPSKEQFKSILENLEANIVTRLASGIHNVISSQTNTAKTAACFHETVEGHFEKLHNNMAEQQSTQSKNQQRFEESQQVFVDYLDDISIKTRETHRTCEEMKNDWAGFSESNSVWRDSLKNNLHNEIIQQLENRESKIVNLEETLHRVSHEWSQKLEGLRSSMLENGQQAEKGLQGAIREIRETLDKRFQEQSAASQDDNSKSETIRSTIEAHLEQVRRQLESVSSGNPESQLLREALLEERKKTSDLQGHLAKLQSDAGTSSELCRREHADLKAMETLKGQLDGMSERVPRVENLNTTFNKMIDLNQILQSTASYLSQEHSWVRNELAAKLQTVTPQESQESKTGSESGYFQGQRFEDTRPGLQAQDIGAKRSRSLSDVLTLDVHTQGERYRRRVVVASPAIEASLPAPPPSIAQEQQRRREPSVQRPILRPATISAKEADPIKTALNHDQYNRLVMARASSAASGTNPAMVEQVRTGLMPRTEKWELPTIEDFTKESVLGGTDGANPNKKRVAHADEGNDIAPVMKKIKSENQDEYGDTSGM
ncbi:hypothetical protein FPSE_05657 [Fusarium pseudograminearum CS3096]|uniref:Uncharacterized protein n=1 Tax=Fusarium pseudograminearum (strain CS3096) TaxID=1028729 RepID=K3W0H4_FUSPC|nr:hypothetical protein FPSE_05657 [Fusarium pseudograminearum CS3096]EKJ74155.1 hypothetical protein FPSE_05657 [Fusarium pseudograminearum CS3096]KAF0641280.1 hypothetical protein FPSE5266_05657 [Fusarium pseudograminearum]